MGSVGPQRRLLGEETKKMGARSFSPGFYGEMLSVEAGELNDGQAPRGLQFWGMFVSAFHTHTHTRTCVHAFHTCQTSTLSWVLSENLFSLWHQRKECDRVSRETRVLPPPRVLPHPDCLLAALSCPSSTEPDQWGRLRPPVPATLCCWGPFPLGKPRPLCAMTPKARCAGFYTVQSSSQQWASTWSQKP